MYVLPSFREPILYPARKILASGLSSFKIGHADICALSRSHSVMFIQPLLWDLLHICFFFFFVDGRKGLLVCRGSSSCADVRVKSTDLELLRALTNAIEVVSSLRVSCVDISHHMRVLRCLSSGFLLQMRPALLVAVSLDRNASDSIINKGRFPFVLLVGVACAHCVGVDRSNVIVKNDPFLPERCALLVAVRSLEFLESLAQIVHVGLFGASETLMAQ